MFFRRGVADDDPWLQVKLWLFSIGALIALLGMLLENQWLIGGAAVVLAAGIVLRWVGGPAEEAADAGEEQRAEDGNEKRRPGP